MVIAELDGSGVRVCVYVRDGENVLQENNGTTPSAYYTQFSGEWGGLLSRRDLVAGQSSYYGFDPQGNARILVTPGAASPDSYGYTGFGMELGTGAAKTNPFRFGGQYGYYRDDPFRLYVRARHYSPDKTRWLSKDPVFASAVYGYAYNNPVSFVDPSGMQAGNAIGLSLEELSLLHSLSAEPLDVFRDPLIEEILNIVVEMNRKYGKPRTAAMLRRLASHPDVSGWSPLVQRLASDLAVEQRKHNPWMIAKGVGEQAFAFINPIEAFKTGRAIGLTARAKFITHTLTLQQSRMIQYQLVHSFEFWKQDSYEDVGRSLTPWLAVLGGRIGASALRSSVVEERLAFPVGIESPSLLGKMQLAEMQMGGLSLLARGGSAPAVVHLTSAEALAKIKASGVFFSPKNVGLYVLDAGRVPRSEFLKRAATMAPSASVPLRITGAAANAFRRPLPLGPVNLYRRLSGVRFAPSGVVNVKTMEFVPDVIYDPKSGLLFPATQWERLGPLLHEAKYFYAIDIIADAGAGAYIYMRCYYLRNGR